MDVGVGSYFNEKYAEFTAPAGTHAEYLTLFASDSLLFEPVTVEAYNTGGYGTSWRDHRETEWTELYDYVPITSQARGHARTDALRAGTERPISRKVHFQDSTGR